MDRAGNPTSRRLGVLASVALLAAAALWLWARAAPPPEDEVARKLFGLWRARDSTVAAALLWCAVAALLLGSTRRGFARLLAASASLVALWIGLELAGIAGLVSYEELLAPAHGSAAELGAMRQPGLDQRGVTREDLALAWNLPTAAIPFRFRTDRRGFRNEPDRADADVYCLGDSCLVAGLVPFGDTVTARLEQRLGRPAMSVALVGLSPQSEAEVLFSSSLPLEGRLVLHFVFEGNDLRDSAVWRGTRERAIPSWSERTLLNQLVLEAQRLTQPQPAGLEHRTGWIGGEAYRFGWLRSSFEGLEGELEPIAQSLGDTRGRVRAAGGSYAVVLIPTKLRVLGPFCRFAPGARIADLERQLGPLPGFLAAWARREGVDFLDLTDALAASTRGGAVPWFPADTHWNEIGHRTAADTIAGWTPVQAWLRARSGS